MAFKRKCDSCGKSYEAKRSDSKYCSGSCRAAASKRSKPQPDVVADTPLGDAASVGLMASTLMELVKAGRENTASGQAALLLAYRLEHSQLDTGASIASMVKQHGATLAEALKGAAKAATALDELKARRDAKRAG